MRNYGAGQIEKEWKKMNFPQMISWTERSSLFVLDEISRSTGVCWACLLLSIGAFACTDGRVSGAEDEAETKGSGLWGDSSAEALTTFQVAVSQRGQSRLTSLGDRSSEGALTWSGLVEVVQNEPGVEGSLLRFVDQVDGLLEIEGQSIQQVSVEGMPAVAFIRSSEGLVSRVQFEEAHDAFAQNLAETLLAHAFPPCHKPMTGTWRSSGTDLQGDYVFQNRAVGPSDKAGAFKYERRLSEYSSLQGLRAQISDISQSSQGALSVSCDASGLEAVSGRLCFSAVLDTVEVHGYELSLDVQRVDGVMEPRPLSTAEREQLDALAAVEDPETWGIQMGELHLTERGRKSLLENKREGIEVKDVVGYAATFEVMDRRPEHNRTFKRAVALVELRSEAATSLADAALEPQVGPKAMAFLMSEPSLPTTAARTTPRSAPTSIMAR